jgi:hypothetical protein
MTHLELSIPVKQRRDVLDALDDQGIEAQIRPVHGEDSGSRCILDIADGVKNVNEMVNAVLGRFNIPVESDAD